MLSNMTDAGVPLNRIEKIRFHMICAIQIVDDSYIRSQFSILGGSGLDGWLHPNVWKLDFGYVSKLGLFL